jgi:hypothetical protein
MALLFVHLQLLDHLIAAAGGARSRAKADDEVEILGGIGGVFVFDVYESTLRLLDEEALLAGVLVGSWCGVSWMNWCGVSWMNEYVEGEMVRECVLPNPARSIRNNPTASNPLGWR